MVAQYDLHIIPESFPECLEGFKYRSVDFDLTFSTTGKVLVIFDDVLQLEFNHCYINTINRTIDVWN